jgi:hypothetical protein
MKINQNQQADIEKKESKIKRHSSTLWLGTYITISLFALAAYVLLKLHIFDLLGKYRILLQRLSLATLWR